MSTTPQATLICVIFKLTLGKVATSHGACGPPLWRLGQVLLKGGSLGTQVENLVICDKVENPVMMWSG